MINLSGFSKVHSSISRNYDTKDILSNAEFFLKTCWHGCKHASGKVLLLISVPSGENHFFWFPSAYNFVQKL